MIKTLKMITYMFRTSNYSGCLLGRSSSLRLLLILAFLSYFGLMAGAVQASSLSMLQDTKPVSVEFRYHNPDAGEVYLVWGIDGWQYVPEELRPEGTIIKNNVMHTPMAFQDGVFLSKVQTPPWKTIDYGFLITKTASGSETNTWEGRDDFRLATTQKDGVVEISTELTPDAYQSPTGASDSQGLVWREIRYFNPSASEVRFVWGLNGWGQIAEEMLPLGTEVKDNVLHTPMQLIDNTFIVKLDVPAGSTIDFGFLIIKDAQGNPAEIWEANGDKDYHETVNESGAIQIQSKVQPSDQPATVRKLPGTLVVGFYILIGLAIVVVVGFIFRRISP